MPVDRWFLVGFWGGDLGVVSKDLEYLEFFKMKSSGSFNVNIYLVGDFMRVRGTGLDC
jgi:hypothetical protein